MNDGELIEALKNGHAYDRDVNAAKNILRIGLDALAEGAVS